MAGLIDPNDRRDNYQSRQEQHPPPHRIPAENTAEHRARKKKERTAQKDVYRNRRNLYTSAGHA